MSTYLYVDNTASVPSDKDLTSITNKLNLTLKEASMWFKNHKLSLNVTKTKFMPFGMPQRLLSCTFTVISYSGTEVELINNYQNPVSNMTVT